MGKTANGLDFGERLFDIPVFETTSARQTVKDLPNLGELPRC